MGGGLSVSLCVFLCVLTVQEGVLYVCVCVSPFSVSLSLCRDSDGVCIVCVFQSSLSPLFSIHNLVSLCLIETQTDSLRDQQKRVGGEHEY